MILYFNGSENEKNQHYLTNYLDLRILINFIKFTSI